MKVLLIEDDPLLGSAIINMLMSHHYTVNSATDGQTGLGLAQTFEYDLILLDVLLPELDGVTVCKRLRIQGCQSPILMLTANQSTADRITGLDAGADDYLTKPFEMEELMARIRALLRRGKPLQTSVLTWENICLNTACSEVTCNGQQIHLTPKEYCLLELFLLNPNRIFNRSAILDRLWDFANSPGEETVSTHIKCLRQKLKKAGASDPIATVHGLGYRLKPAAEEAPAPAPAPDESTRQRIKARNAKLWEKFKDRFLAQCAMLQQASEALTAGNLASDLQQQAHQSAHKLAGSLGIFGFMSGSRLAKELEELFQSSRELEPAQAQRIAQLVSALQRELQKSPEIETATDHYLPLVLVLDHDLKLVEQIQHEAPAWKLRVEMATNLTIARQMLAQGLPDIILLDLNFPQVDDALSWLRDLTQQANWMPMLAFTGAGSLEDRLNVAQFRGCIFLQKPLPVNEVLNALTDLLGRRQVSYRNRVLIVDDDEAVVSQLTHALRPWDVEVKGLSNPQQFWNVLTDTNPNLLVLDLEMPGINGIELCQVVRSDPKWRHLPIVFLSAHTEATRIDHAFAVGADDYISKSMTGEALATQIIRRLKGVGFQKDGMTESKVIA